MKRLRLFVSDESGGLNDKFNEWIDENKPEIISAQFKNGEGYYRYEVLVTYDDNEGVQL